VGRELWTQLRPLEAERPCMALRSPRTPKVLLDVCFFGCLERVIGRKRLVSPRQQRRRIGELKPAWPFAKCLLESLRTERAKAASFAASAVAVSSNPMLDFPSSSISEWQNIMCGAFWWVGNRGSFQPWCASQLDLIRDLEF